MREFKLVLLVLAMVLGSVTLAAGAKQVKSNASVHSLSSGLSKAPIPTPPRVNK